MIIIIIISISIMIIIIIISSKNKFKFIKKIVYDIKKNHNNENNKHDSKIVYSLTIGNNLI